ncbi:MAG: FMN-binding protein [Coriobacteriales bacterium]|nr:FMN-binding protein [Coriobacteriales bacterium]
MINRTRVFGGMAVAFALVASMGLVACGGGSPSYKDGTYTGQSAVFEDEDGGNGNGYGVATVTIKDGKIAACEFKTYEPDGTLKEGTEYGMVNGKIGNQDYYNKAQKALAANPIYCQQLVDTGMLEGVDVVSGATISYGEFQEAVQYALDQAK